MAEIDMTAEGISSPDTLHIRAAEPADAALLARLIRESHRDVAVKFGLTGTNCPKHPSFCTEEWLAADFARGERYFMLYRHDEPVGCVACERPEPSLAYLNRLSVLPSCRNLGYGTRLVRFIFELARRDEVETISIGVIGEHSALQEWYVKLGFSCGPTKRFPHLPFSVRYMSYAVSGV